jgi:hypothetical protein
MDPDETLRLLINALSNGNYTRAAEHARELQDWRTRGGMEPLNPDWRAYVRQALH